MNLFTTKSTLFLFLVCAFGCTTASAPTDASVPVDASALPECNSVGGAPVMWNPPFANDAGAAGEGWCWSAADDYDCRSAGPDGVNHAYHCKALADGGGPTMLLCD